MSEPMSTEERARSNSTSPEYRYETARKALYRALSGNCSHDLRECLIDEFERAVLARPYTGPEIK